VHEADQDAFLDGGGERRRVPWEEWRRRRMEGPSYDPRLWIVAADGGRVAGCCIGMPWGDDRPEVGWIARLGVRRPWRGRGLGRALLARALRRLRERGFARAGLGVRLDNERALALYRGAGMEVFARYAHWRRMFAGGEDVVS
jgi:ribosomal protein S18 acetylase RimI-like enzyme